MTAAREWVRDIALTLASLCIVVMTALVLYAWASIGDTLRDVGTPDPATSYECVPAPPDWPC